jgi:hypothetical protein
VKWEQGEWVAPPGESVDDEKRVVVGHNLL